MREDSLFLPEYSGTLMWDRIRQCFRYWPASASCVLGLKPPCKLALLECIKGKQTLHFSFLPRVPSSLCSVCFFKYFLEAMWNLMTQISYCKELSPFYNLILGKSAEFLDCSVLIPFCRILRQKKKNRLLKLFCLS